jgi:hypothetical protein
MPQVAVDKSRTKNDWHNNPESPMHFSRLRASGQGLFALYMLSLGVTEAPLKKTSLKGRMPCNPPNKTKSKKSKALVRQAT